MIFLKKARLYLPIVLITISSNSCMVIKNKYFSYTIKTYSIDKEKKLLSTAKLISYEDYLFEFIMQVNISETLANGNSLSQIEYTTNGVYVLRNNSDSFFQFDTFSLNNKLVKTGKISEKESGVRYQNYETQQTINPALYMTLPIDTVINNTQCYYVDINLSVKNIDSTSYEQKIFLYKAKNLNSFYKIWNANYIDTSFCIIGMYFFDKKNNQGFVEEPDSVNLLTKEEREICREILKKCNTN